MPKDQYEVIYLSLNQTYMDTLVSDMYFYFIGIGIRDLEVTPQGFCHPSDGYIGF